MNKTPEVPSLANTNCSQPRQVGFVEPLQAVLVKGFVLSWSEYTLLAGVPAPVAVGTGPLSVTTPLTLSKVPIAVDTKDPADTWATTSLPLPTIKGGRGPCRGPCGYDGAVTHVLACHWWLG